MLPTYFCTPSCCRCFRTAVPSWTVSWPNWSFCGRWASVRHGWCFGLVPVSGWWQSPPERLVSLDSWCAGCRDFDFGFAGNIYQGSRYTTQCSPLLLLYWRHSRCSPPFSNEYLFSFLLLFGLFLSFSIKISYPLIKNSFSTSVKGLHTIQRFPVLCHTLRWGTQFISSNSLLFHQLVIFQNPNNQ